jgi:Icc-related predicted phosphoesterase
MEQVKVLTATDLHLKPTLYDQLGFAVEKHKPDVACLIGDFLDRPDENQHRYNSITPKAAAKRLAALPCEVVFVIGNHEKKDSWAAFFKAWKATGRKLNVLHGTCASFGPLKIVGFPCEMGGVQEYDGVQRLTTKHYNGWLPQVLWNEDVAAHTLWLMHEPPIPELGEEWAVNKTWREALELYRPILVVSGHDHLTPLTSGVRTASFGPVTTCVNVGQTVSPIAGPLSYCLITFEFASRTPSLPSRTTVEPLVWPMAMEIPF